MRFPAVSIRSSIERPEALETGSTVLTGLHAENVLSAVDFSMKNFVGAAIPVDYEVDDFSQRVVGFLLSTATLHGEWANLRERLGGVQ